MKLKEKFEQWFINDDEDHYEGLVETVAIAHEKVAEYSAIEFAEFVTGITYKLSEGYFFYYYNEEWKTTKELLEIYKKGI